MEISPGFTSTCIAGNGSRSSRFNIFNRNEQEWGRDRGEDWCTSLWNARLIIDSGGG